MVKGQSLLFVALTRTEFYLHAKGMERRSIRHTHTLLAGVQGQI
jgi:hypothetical protein